MAIGLLQKVVSVIMPLPASARVLEADNVLPAPLLVDQSTALPAEADRSSDVTTL